MTGLNKCSCLDKSDKDLLVSVLMAEKAGLRR